MSRVDNLPNDKTITRRDSVIHAAENNHLGVLSVPLRIILSLPGWVLFALVALLVGSVVSFGGLSDVPESLSIGRPISRSIDKVVDWMVVTWDPFFRTVNIVLLRYFLLPLERWLLLLPWWLLTMLVALAAKQIVSWKFGIVAAGLMIGTAALGLFDLAMASLALVITSALIAVLIGIPSRRIPVWRTLKRTF